MELTQLKQFKAVAEQENLSKAAEIVFVTQPTLTKAMHNLEEELGVDLFDRTGKKITLNQNGEIVLQYVNKILSDIDEMIGAVKQNALTRELRICSSIDTISYFVIPGIFSKTSIPINSQSFTDEEIKNLLISKKYDIAFSTNPIEGKGITNILLYKDYAGISTSPKHSINSQNTISLDDIRNKRIATYDSNNPLTVLCKNVLNQYNIVYEKQTNQIALELYLKNKDTFALASLSSKYSGSTIFQYRAFIPFEKDAGLSVPVYMSYYKTNSKIDDIESIQDTLEEYYIEYNKNWCNF